MVNAFNISNYVAGNIAISVCAFVNDCLFSPVLQYRPGQWSWRRSEARYTAATIHM